MATTRSLLRPPLLALLALLALGCACGANPDLPPATDGGCPDAPGADEGDGGLVQADTVCSPEGRGCASTADCCQQPWGMLCAAFEGDAPQCHRACLSDSDCETDAQGAHCDHVAGEPYGACMPA